MEDQVVATEDLLRREIFEKGLAQVLFALDGEGREVGFALFFHNFSTFLGRGGIYLEDLFVLPEARGKGMGGVLIRHAEEACRRLGFPSLYLTTDLQGYYERYGYSFLGTGYGPDGGESRIYGKELKKDETP